MKLEIKAFQPGGRIPWTHCLMVPGDGEGVQIGPDRSPLIRWSEVPAGTRSFALILVDPDAPADFGLINREGVTIAVDFPRTEFHHWVLVDVPGERRELPEGAESDGFKPRGKPVGRVGHGIRGQNDLTLFFRGDPEMEGTYGGFDGPAPPANDERLHHYHFRLYALDVPSLDLSPPFGAKDALAAMKGHVLALAEYIGTCTLHPKLR